MSQPAHTPTSSPATARATADRRAEPGAGSRVFYLTVKLGWDFVQPRIVLMLGCLL